MREDEMLASWDETLALLDAYESLLSDAQKETLTLYFRFNLSLSEIAEERGTSRTAIFDAIKKGVAKLRHYESCLGLAKKTLAAERSMELLKNDGQRIEALQLLEEAFNEEKGDTHGI